ncbi:MAG: DUF4406 domain-containing protein [Patescibacteria group bacterium]
MRNEIQSAIKGLTKLENVLQEVNNLLNEIRKQSTEKRIGYVAGIITSDGKEHMQRNIDILEKHTEKIKKQYGFPIFSAVDIFGNGVYQKLDDFNQEERLREKSFIEFWRKILSSGHVTNIFMTPRWKESKGATDEHETAKKLGIKIHYI